jgi:hypothetical protein
MEKIWYQGVHGIKPGNFHDGDFGFACHTGLQEVIISRPGSGKESHYYFTRRWFSARGV